MISPLIYRPFFRHLGRYMLALGLVGAGVLLCLSMPQVMSPRPFLAFWPVVVVAAELGGIGPGLLATIASSLCVDIILHPPYGDLNLHDWVGMTVLGIFLVGGSAISVFIGGKRKVQSRQRLQAAAMQAAANGIALTDAKGVILWVNPAFCALTGYAPKEIVGKTLWLLDSEEQSEAVYRNLWNTVQQGDAWHGELVRRRKDGTSYVEDRSVTPLTDADGRIIHYVLIMQDITERKQTEEDLRVSETRLRLLTKAGNIGLWDWDLQTNDVIYSPEWKNQIGYRDEEISNHFNEWQSRVHPDDLEQTLQKVQTFIANPQNKHEVEFRFRHKDGSYRWIYTHADVLRDADGKLTRMLGSHVDITDRKRSEQEREQLQAQLNQAQRMEAVGRLAGGVAHDFNNMLGIILGHADLVLDEIDPDGSIYHDVIEIKNAAERSADLTRQLLAFARKQTIIPKVLDLNGTVSEILRLLRRLIGEDISLAWKPGMEVWPVKMDPSQIDQILANLAVNARDAFTGVGSITIETANIVFDDSYCDTHKEFTPGSYVMLAVSDNGCGMDRETMGLIFEPFFTTKELGKGTGLGLATVYGIVKQNHGFINVYSEPGQGTTFKIYIPRADEPTTKKPAVLLKRDLRGKETVLLVEDEDPMLALGTTILQRNGYEVLATNSPNKALGMAQRHPGPIHLLITDVVMPEMNGKDLKERLAEIKSGFKIIFMSGYTANVIAHHGIIDEEINFLQKPFAVKTLLEKVRDVLDG